MTDLNLFTSTFALIFLAEFPDKTALAIVLLASRRHPLAVFWGVGLAFTLQCIVAVTFGRVLGLLPPVFVHAGASLMFFAFAVHMWIKKDPEISEVSSDAGKGTFRKALQGAFLVIFIAEWGDLTQLATAALEAKFHKPYLLFGASALALWSTTAILVFIGHHSKRVINPVKLKKIGALVFAGVGVWMAYSAWKAHT